jgi:hypothetical protein
MYLRILKQFSQFGSKSDFWETPKFAFFSENLFDVLYVVRNLIFISLEQKQILV